mmetsp:Transcript_109191/g.348549  ORF Transcript_109191/g.348549 Transcript_109191/m.348549 type:complete len:357 (-) Transcript_109191:111-1181(-)
MMCAHPHADGDRRSGPLADLDHRAVEAQDCVAFDELSKGRVLLVRPQAIECSQGVLENPHVSVVPQKMGPAELSAVLNALQMQAEGTTATRLDGGRRAVGAPDTTAFDGMHPVRAGPVDPSALYASQSRLVRLLRGVWRGGPAESSLVNLAVNSSCLAPQHPLALALGLRRRPTLRDRQGLSEGWSRLSSSDARLSTTSGLFLALAALLLVPQRCRRRHIRRRRPIPGPGKRRRRRRVRRLGARRWRQRQRRLRRPVESEGQLLLPMLLLLLPLPQLLLLQCPPRGLPKLLCVLLWPGPHNGHISVQIGIFFLILVAAIPNHLLHWNVLHLHQSIVAFGQQVRPATPQACQTLRGA